MTPPTKVLDAARLLGMKTSEIRSADSDGDDLVVETTDGVVTRVAADGSMSFTVPGAAVVEEPPADDDPLAGLDKDGLVAFAEEHGLEVNGRLGEAKLRESLAEQLVVAADDDPGEDDENSGERGDDDA